MKIKIAQRYTPFSHQPGHRWLLPHSLLGFQIFPTLIRVLDATQYPVQLLEEIPIPVQGPVKEFTVQQNLEKGCLSVWGHTIDGYLSYTISANTEDPQKYSITVKKSPVTFPLPAANEPNLTLKPLLPRLALGVDKMQDLDLIRRRLDLAEILPLWHRLSLFFPRNAQEQPPHDLTLSDLKNLFLAGFEASFWPRLKDEDHQGIPFKGLTHHSSPLSLLSIGAEAIEKFLIDCKQDSIRLLPKLPVEFHCGRMLNFACGELGSIDLEWTKKMMRRLIFHSHTQRSIAFHFPKQIDRYRLKLNHEKEPGIWMKNGDTITLKPGQRYLFDRFEC